MFKKLLIIFFIVLLIECHIKPFFSIVSIVNNSQQVSIVNNSQQVLTQVLHYSFSTYL